MTYFYAVFCENTNDLYGAFPQVHLILLFTKMQTTTYQLAQKTIDFLSQTQKMYINGEFCEAISKKTFDSINPANGKILAKIPFADQADIDQAVLAARKAFEQVWKKNSPAQKGELLWKLADLIERDKQIFCELESLDNGKPVNKAEYDVNSTIAHFRYYAGWASKIEGAVFQVGQGKTAFTKREPLGVCGLIVPWNFPLMMAAWKLAPALACGNTCILKPAEQTPLTALYLAKLVQEAGFPAGVVNVVTGFGIPTGQAMTLHTNIDKISFTGSTAAGRKIQEAAAKSNLKKVSLELGGKSPNVVFADADLDKVIDALHWTSFYNSGQECTLGSRLFIQKPIFEQLTEKLIQNAEKLTIGNGLEKPDLGPLISQNQLQTVLSYIDSGIEQGAELRTGGKRLQGDLADGYFLPPTLFVHQNDQLKIVKEEIFGPVVVLSSFDSFDEIVQRANDTPYGLAAAVWTQDISKALRFVDALDAGTVWVNSYDLFDPAVPFGGFKESGFGKEMGKSAIELYTREKSVWLAY